MEDFFYQQPYNNRVMLVKDGCGICPEILKAVNIFNARVKRGETIDIIRAEDTNFRRYSHFFSQILGSKTIPTPLIWFEGHVLKWQEGGPDWYETYYHLKELNRLKRG